MDWRSRENGGVDRIYADVAGSSDGNHALKHFQHHPDIMYYDGNFVPKRAWAERVFRLSPSGMTNQTNNDSCIGHVHACACARVCVCACTYP